MLQNVEKLLLLIFIFSRKCLGLGLLDLIEICSKNNRINTYFNLELKIQFLQVVMDLIIQRCSGLHNYFCGASR